MRTQDILTRNLPGIPSQRTRRTARKPVVAAKPDDKPKTYCPEIPVSDTYADGAPHT